MKSTLDKVCKKHGLTSHVEEQNGYYRCKLCRNKHVVKWRQEVKAKLVEAFGGKCQVCGYDRCMRNLTFHHRDPSKKDFTISMKGRTSSFETLRLEAEKCVLLCCLCHGEVHEGLLSI